MSILVSHFLLPPRELKKWDRNTTIKFRPLVFYTFWQNDFLKFSPYKFIETQIWPCRKQVKDQPKVIIWTNLVDFEFWMLYTKMQPQCRYDQYIIDSFT